MHKTSEERRKIEDGTGRDPLRRAGLIFFHIGKGRHLQPLHERLEEIPVALEQAHGAVAIQQPHGACPRRTLPCVAGDQSLQLLAPPPTKSTQQPCPPAK